MINLLKNNIQLFIRYFEFYLNKFNKDFLKIQLAMDNRSSQDISSKTNIDFTTNQIKAATMSTSKSIILFSSKTIILLILVNFFLVNPIKQVIYTATEAFNQNPIIKIIGMDFIRNPMTLIRMGNYYLDKGKLDQAELYMSYAEILITQYPYPKRLYSDLNLLKERINQAKKVNPN